MHPRSYRPLRHLLVAALTALLLGSILSLPANAQAEARDVDEACAVAPESSFSDRGDGERAEAIDCVAYYGITQGKTATTYAPLDPVSRDQMASFLVRTLQVAGADIPEPGQPFDDVPANNTHKRNIEILRATGITLGTGENSYNPAGLVTRAQMASFIARQIEYVIDPETLPEPSEDYFTDDEGEEQHEERINQLAEVGIVQGTGPETYNPGARVTRAQMALFLARDLDYMTEEHGVLLRRISTASTAVTAGPDLIDVAIATSGSTTTLLFEFDEAVGTTTPAVRFKVWSYTAEATTATSANRDSQDPTVVRAVFSTADVVDATTASVERFAVQDASGTPNPEGAIGLQTVELDAGETRAPDLVDVERPGTSPQVWDFTFDEPAFPVNAESPSGYGLVLDDGTQVTEVASVTPSTDGRTHSVTFSDADAGKATRVVRGFVATGTVADAAEDGNPNPQQAATVATISNEAPRLESIQLRFADNQAVLVFNQAIDIVMTSALPGFPESPAGQVRAYDVSGGEQTTSNLAKTANNTITATFGSLSELTAGISIDAGTVESSVTDRPNGVDELGVAATFGPLETAAPDLLLASKGGNETDRSVTFLFDAVVGSVVDTNPDFFASNYRLYVSSEDGTATELTDCAVGSGDAANTVTCTAAADSDVGQAIDAAVLATIRHDAVLDSSGNYGNYDAGAAI